MNLARSRSQSSNHAAQEMENLTIAARVHAVGVLCPIPLIRTAKAMKALGTGDVLELLADDRVVLIDLPNWCRSWRHEYLGHVEEGGGVLHVYVRKGSR